MSFDAESALVGAVLLDANAFWQVADTLQAEDFASGKLRRLWDVTASLIREGSAADAVTIGEISPDLAALALELASTTPGSRNARSYAEIVARRAMERRVISAGQQIAKLSGEGVYAEAVRLLTACQPRGAGSARQLKAFMREWFAKASERAVSDDEMTGVPTSLTWLDDHLGGYQPGDLIILAARPSVGKTALGLQSALHAATHGHAAVMFSAEMSGTQVADRAVSHLGGVSTKSLRQPKTMTDDDWNRVTHGVTVGGPLPLWIDDSTNISAEDIGARVRQLDAVRKIGLVVIDYLSHLKMPKADRNDLAIGETTRSLKRMAKAMGIPVVLLAQLNRDGANTRPTLAHLRGSGDIEQDADVVLFLHRPDEMQRGTIELIVAKQRNGPTGECWLHADMEHMRFLPGEAPEQQAPAQKRRGFSGSKYIERVAQQ